MSDSEEPLPSEGGDDLFGDAGSDAGSDGGRALSDRELPSDPAAHSDEELIEDYGDEPPAPTRENRVQLLHMYRHRIPKSKDSQLQSLRVPKFLKFFPEEYKPDTWEPTKYDLDNAQAPNAVPVVRYRRDPATGKLQSNANIYRWSDGSVTMAVGDEHYEIQTKSLAPPPNKPYNEIQDAHYYVAAAHLSTNCLLTVGHLTEQYTVRPNKDVQDDALEQLQRRLEEASRSKTGDNLIITTREDPELQRKQAELAEKERNKAQRRRETAAAKMDGVGRYNRGALSIGDLEGGRRGPAAGRKRGQGGQNRARKRNAEYDSDDDLPSGARKDDEYVMDEFVVASDEGSEEVEDDEDEEDILDDEDDEDEAPRRKRQKTAEAEDEDEDADGEADEDAAPAVPAESSSRRRRRVVHDDDDE